MAARSRSASMPRVAGDLASHASGIGQYSIRVALMIGLLRPSNGTAGRAHTLAHVAGALPRGAVNCRRRSTKKIMAHRGLKFGIFLAPFHRVGENPTLALARDMELIEWLDHLGYDEAWIGEHHSAGWELIASPELVIAAAAERTRHIMLGSGVTSLPYHHPLLVANRFVQLDHMTRGRAMLGCGPGQRGDRARRGRGRVRAERRAARGVAAADDLRRLTGWDTVSAWRLSS